MAEDTSIHVTPHGGQWGVRSGDADEPDLVFPNRLDAVHAAREAAKTAGVDVLYHGPTGNVVYREEVNG